MSLIKTAIEKFLPNFLSEKIISSVKSYKKKRKYEKRFSYGKGKPFVYNVNVLGVSFKIVLDPFKNCYVDESIAENGYWEKELGLQLIKHVHENTIFLDIGANIGYHSLFVASILNGTGKVYSFEPISYLCKQIEESVDLNNFKNIEVCNFGLAEHEGEAEIYLRDENIGGSTLLDLSKRDDFKVKESEKVYLKSLDSFLGVTNKVDVIKIDVEGYEYEAFKGAYNILKNNHPIIFMEFSPSLYTKDRAEKPQEIVSFLKNIGYSFSTLDEKVLDLEKWLKESNNKDRQIDIMCKVI